MCPGDASDEPTEGAGRGQPAPFFLPFFPSLNFGGIGFAFVLLGGDHCGINVVLRGVEVLLFEFNTQNETNETYSAQSRARIHFFQNKTEGDGPAVSRDRWCGSAGEPLPAECSERDAGLNRECSEG